MLLVGRLGGGGGSSLLMMGVRSAMAVLCCAVLRAVVHRRMRDEGIDFESR